MKLPALQFYPADWRKDPGVQSLTFAARGVWVEMLCLMHESPRRGFLMLPNGRALSDEALARVIGAERRELANALAEIIGNGVADRDEETGALLNRRMVRDQAKRETAKMDGEGGGNPRLKTGYSSPGFVYFVQDTATHHFKIGIAQNVKNRVAKLRSLLCKDLQTMAVVAVEDMGAAETEYHRIYSGQHVGGEWYALTETDILTLKGKAKGKDNEPLSVTHKGKAMGPLNPNPRASSSSSSSSSDNTPKVPKGTAGVADGVEAEFEEFWTAVPTKIARGAALKAWRTARQKTTAADIMAGMPGFVAYEARRKQLADYRPLHPATWLNAERWTDEIPAPVRIASSTSLKNNKDVVARVLGNLPAYRAWLAENYEAGQVATQADPRTARVAVLQRFIDHLDRKGSAS